VSHTASVPSDFKKYPDDPGPCEGNRLLIPVVLEVPPVPPRVSGREPTEIEEAFTQSPVVLEKIPPPNTTSIVGLPETPLPFTTLIPLAAAIVLAAPVPSPVLTRIPLAVTPPTEFALLEVAV
jgi:hypothetical protein